MGFAETVSHVVWLVALAALFGVALDAHFDSVETLRAAKDARLALEAERMRTHIVNATFCHDGTSIEVTAVNAGDASIDVDGIDFLVDGVLTAGFAASIGGDTATDLWLSDEVAVFTKAAASAPSDMQLVTENGVPIYVAPRTCA